MSIKKEVDILVNTLKGDPGYYYTWQANIAMAFKDEYNRATENGKIVGIDLHSIANNAAKNFLDLLIRSK